MAKTVYNTTLSYTPVILENLKLKYRVLPGIGTGKNKAKYPPLEVESLLTQDNRDVRFLFSQKELDAMALNDYIKETQGEVVE